MEENVDRPYQYHYLHFYSILVNLSIADYHIRKLKLSEIAQRWSILISISL